MAVPVQYPRVSRLSDGRQAVFLASDSQRCRTSHARGKRACRASHPMLEDVVQFATRKSLSTRCFNSTTPLMRTSAWPNIGKVNIKMRARRGHDVYAPSIQLWVRAVAGTLVRLGPLLESRSCDDAPCGCLCLAVDLFDVTMTDGNLRVRLNTTKICLSASTPFRSTTWCRSWDISTQSWDTCNDPTILAKDKELSVQMSRNGALGTQTLEAVVRCCDRSPRSFPAWARESAG